MKPCFILSVIAAFSALPALAETSKDPHIGYFYPAGAKQGTSIRVTVGGQNLRGTTQVYISGDGVAGKVIQYQGRLKALKQDQREELQRRLAELRQKYVPQGARNRLVQPERKAEKSDPNVPAKPAEPVVLPDHPMLRNLDALSLEGLQKVTDEFIRPNLNQINPQIAETVVIEITVDSKASPGDYDIRLASPQGLTNPMRFEIGTLPELREPDFADPGKPAITQMAIPSVINGQILPGEVDRFRFHAEPGQHLVIETHARRLIPYLGDAVPGWFQPTLKLLDSVGSEVAYADDYRFDPDPVVFYQIPKAGNYTLEICDAIYRGREDFVYRIMASESPFVTRLFPLGGQSGKTLLSALEGWNLTDHQAALNTQPDGPAIRRMELTQNGLRSNTLLYRVDTLPECDEAEGNDTLDKAQKVTIPHIINGRIDRVNDQDVFEFEGHADQNVVVEVFGRRLNSPIDSLIQLMDDRGKVLGWNDDSEDKESGLMTHYADSCMMVRLPRDGTYCVRLSEVQRHGGSDYGYRLRISQPIPDFSVLINPASINLTAGRAVPIDVHVFRKDGFEGDIDVALAGDSSGLILGGGHIPAGRNDIRMTLTAPRTALDKPIAIHIEGRAQISGRQVIHKAVACQDMMQAFFYRHYVPFNDILAAVGGPRRSVQQIRLAEESPIVRIASGGMAPVIVRIPPIMAQQNVQVELSESPEGITIQEVVVQQESLKFMIKTDATKVKAGFADNLIVEAWGQVPKRGPDGTQTNQTQRVSFGVLPAIPIEITSR